MPCRIATLFLGAWALLSSGCGFAEYDKRMDEQKVFLDRFDEENMALGHPLFPPEGMQKIPPDPKNPKGQQQGWKKISLLPVNFFLRPPKKTAQKFKEKEGGFGFPVTLYRYAGPAGFDVLVTTSLVLKDSEAKDNKSKKKGLTPADFQKQVRTALSDFYQKEMKRVTPPELFSAKLDKRTYSVPRGKGKTVNLVYETMLFTDKPRLPPGKGMNPKEQAKYTSFRLYFHQDGVNQAAVIYRFPISKENDNTLAKALQLSIESLVLGDKVLHERQEFNKVKRS